MADTSRVVYEEKDTPRPYGFAGRMRNLLGIIRPGNVMMIGAGVLVGRLLAQASLTGQEILLAVVSACLIGAGANVANDYSDRKRDFRNHPERPLPAGRVAPLAALLLAGTSSLVGLLLAAALSLAHLTLAIAITILLWLYNFRLKDLAVAGNLVVSACVAASVLYGAIGHAPDLFVWTGVLFAFAMTLCREITKDIQDYRGDAEAGAHTLPIIAGIRRSRIMAATLTGVVAVAAPVPYLLLAFSSAYLALILVADAAMLVAMWYLVRDGDTSDDASSASFALKSAMIFGLVGLALATDSWI